MSARGPWRLIDTGLRPAADNIAINRAILEAHQAGEAPATLRFLRFEPCALVGFHQSVDQELRRDYCGAHGIAVQRRITGGGAIYLDPAQIGWELYLDRPAVGTADMLQVARRICEMAAGGIRRLGVDARFRPRNDIEVDGRKISGTGGAFDGDSILYQGTLLIDFDVARMLRVLCIPAEKLSHKAIAQAAERVTDLKRLLGRAPERSVVQGHLAQAFAEGFGAAFEPVACLSAGEERRRLAALAEIDRPDWVYQIDRPASEAPVLDGLHKAEGGLVRARVAVDRARGRIRHAWFTGDFFVNPKRMVADLEATLRDAPLEDYRRRLHEFFDAYPVEMLMLRGEDFVLAMDSALRGLGAR